ncbi:MAG: hypothetical protein V4709_15555 [Pseudomonadota bacterium]
MGRAELLQKLDQLSPHQRAAVEQLVDSMASAKGANPSLEQVIAAAKACVQPAQTLEAIDADVRAMRGEWSDRGWQAPGA